MIPCRTHTVYTMPGGQPILDPRLMAAVIQSPLQDSLKPGVQHTLILQPGEDLDHDRDYHTSAPHNRAHMLRLVAKVCGFARLRVRARLYRSVRTTDSATEPGSVSRNHYLALSVPLSAFLTSASHSQPPAWPLTP